MSFTKIFLSYLTIIILTTVQFSASLWERERGQDAEPLRGRQRKRYPGHCKRETQRE